jgi:hypothetical protein
LKGEIVEFEGGKYWSLKGKILEFEGENHILVL